MVQIQDTLGMGTRGMDMLTQNIKLSTWWDPFPIRSMKSRCVRNLDYNSFFISKIVEMLQYLSFSRILIRKRSHGLWELFTNKKVGVVHGQYGWFDHTITALSKVEGGNPWIKGAWEGWGGRFIQATPYGESILEFTLHMSIHLYPFFWQGPWAKAD